MNKSPKIQAVIFDVGGVLLYDVWEHLFLDEDQGLVSLYGLSREKLEAMGKELWEEFAYVSASAEQTWQKIEEEYWANFLEKFNEEFLPQQIPSIEQLVELSKKFIKPVNKTYTLLLLEKLKERKITLAICSNNNEFWFARQMEVSGFDRFFLPQNIVLSCKIGVSKSHPSGKMFKEVLNALNLPGGKTMFVDDRQENIKKAKEFEIHSVLFPSESQNGMKELEQTLSEYL